MEMNTDYHMPSDSRSPSRPATPIQLLPVNDINNWLMKFKKFTLLIQGLNSTLKSLTTYGKFNTEDPVVASSRPSCLNTPESTT
ncbi:hypothetical protein TNCV_4712361 [Trichonephila clavipes]|nr:hypothetical protein TNCV_4712361 [Trichonephila clavipes]